MLFPLYMKDKPKYAPTIEDVEVLKIEGPWGTKSSGQLYRLYMMDRKELKEFQHLDKRERNSLSKDIRGQKAYIIKGIPRGQLGGAHFHRARDELLFCLDGKLTYQLDDVHGGQQYYELDQSNGLYIPPFVAHTYWAIHDNNTLLAISNTLWFPKDQCPDCEDTYDMEAFEELKKLYG